MHFTNIGYNPYLNKSTNVVMNWQYRIRNIEFFYAENIIEKRMIIIANDIKVFRKYILCDAIYEF